MAVAYQSVASSNSATVSKPTGVVSGDLMVALVFSYSGAASLSGWTSVAGASGSYSSTYYGTLLWKIAGGSEPANYTFTSSGAVFQAIIVRVDGHDATTPIDVSSVITSGTGVIPSVTTTGADELLIGYAISTGAITFDASMTERAEVGPDTTYNAFYTAGATEVRASAGATGTRTMTVVGTAVVAGMVAIKAAGSGGVTVSAGLAGNTTRAHLAPTAVTGAARAIITALPNTTRTRIAPAAVRGSARAIITALPNTTRTRLAPSSVTGAARAIITAMPGTTRAVLAATAFERVNVTVTPSLLAGVTHDLLAPTVVFGSTVAAPVAGGVTHDVLPVGSVGVGSTITPALLDGVTRALLAPDILTGATTVASVAGGISRALYAPMVGVLLPRQAFDGSVLTTDGASPVRGVSTSTNGIRGRTTDGVPGVRGRLP